MLRPAASAVQRGAVLTFTVMGASAGARPGFVALPANFLPEAISGDGQVVVGAVWNYGSGQHYAARWTATTALQLLTSPQLPAGVAGDASHDGSVVVGGGDPAFRWTASSSPERHLQAAAWLGFDVRGAGASDAGDVLASAIIELMRKTRMPNGLRAVGFDERHIEDLVKGTLPQHRVTKLAPRPAAPEDLAGLFRGAMSYWE